MAIKQLDDEQVRTWTLEEKDRWWRENVYRGDEPQLTIRSALTGMILGGLLSLTNLYVGAKTGWTLGVGITSVILAFAAFKVMSKMGLAKEFHLLENNAMQSIATAAGYMTGPLISSLAAYMIVTDAVIPQAVVWTWLVALGILGVLFAFPLKRRFINDEQHPFPEGRAAGVVMDALHTGDGKDGLLKAKILAITAGVAAVLKTLQSAKITEALYVQWLHIPEHLDGWIYKLTTLKVGGIDLRELTVRADTDFVMMAAGGLMGIRTGVSIMIGAIINYCILVPYAIGLGDIHGTVEGDVTHYGFGAILKWALWCGVSMMTTASLFAFLSKPKIILSAFTGLFSKKEKKTEDVLADVELPMVVFAIGIPIVGGLVVALAWLFFDVEIWLGLVGIPLIFVFTLIGVNSTALTSITPVGSLGKLTQLTYAVLAPGNITTNMATAGITAEVAGNSANLLMDIKPGYMLGAKPRHQAVGHVLGILAGASAAVPIFYLLFLQHGPGGMISEEYPMPSASAWKAIAEILTNGIDTLPVSARWGALVGGVVGIALEALRTATKGKFWLSGVAIGLAFMIPFSTCLAMFLGGLFFWVSKATFEKPDSFGKRVIVDNMEPICAGVIAGGALTGITLVILENFVL